MKCNHKIHFKCYYEFICLHMSNGSNEFECPLCKKLSNIIIFDFSFLIKNNYDIIKGINYEQENLNLNQFYKEDKDNKYQSLLNYNILAFENYLTKLCKKEILIKDIIKDEIFEKQIFQLIVEDFEEFTIYYSLTNNKEEQIDIWKNILYGMRLLYQFKVLNLSNSILISFNIIKFNVPNNVETLLMMMPFSNLINQFIINSIILFEPNEVNREKIKNIFLKEILLYLICESFIIKSNNKDVTLDEFIINNKEEFRKILDLFKLKCKICLLLLGGKEENLNINISLEDALTLIKSNTNFLNSINLSQFKIQNLPVHILEQSLEIPEFNIFNLPESGIEFFHKSNRNCLYCHKQNLYSYFCLLCGNKICSTVDCFVEDESKGKKDYPII